MRKHATGAMRTKISLTLASGWAILDVRDDGSGRFGTSAEGGYGLRALRERLGELGGTLDVSIEPGEGAVLTAKVPCGGGGRDAETRAEWERAMAAGA